MAGILNSVYIVLVVLFVLGGLGIVLKRVTETGRDDPRWLEMVSVVAVLLFVLALGGEFLV